MKNQKVIVLAVIVLAIVMGVGVYDYTFNSKHRDIANEEATITLSAKELFSHFQKDELLATTNYLDKVIEIEGTITSIEEGEVVLSNQIQVRFKTELMPKVVNEASIIIKGRCVGFDELLEMVKIDQATIINKEY
jgi:cell division protein YceG involved in septum cleavage